MTEDNAVPLQHTTISIQAFIDSHDPTLADLNKSALIEMYYLYLNLKSIITRLEEITSSNTHVMSSEEKQNYYGNILDSYRLSAKKVYIAAQSCLHENNSHACELPTLHLKQITWPLNSGGPDRCEALRLKGLELGLYQQDFYFMAKKRGFVPLLFQNSKYKWEVTKWLKCDEI